MTGDLKDQKLGKWRFGRVKIGHRPHWTNTIWTTGNSDESYLGESIWTQNFLDEWRFGQVKNWTIGDLDQ